MTLWIRTVFFDVLFGNRQRVRRDIYRVDFRFREGIKAQAMVAMQPLPVHIYLKICCGCLLMSPANLLLISSPIGERGTSTRSST